MTNDKIESLETQEDELVTQEQQPKTPDLADLYKECLTPECDC